VTAAKALVLFPGEFDAYPKCRAYIASHFTFDVRDDDQLLLLRSER
jgi:hypothetical protein